MAPDVNLYQYKKTVAQGMMDLALVSANANQLRYVLQTDGGHSYYYPSLVMIGASLFLQITVGIGLIWNSRYNVKNDSEMCKAVTANNYTVIGIFLVTILNVFISSFGVIDQMTAATR
uniref:ninjurin-1-like n=1 Tax=Osmia lignaria TaxID=473952 RepID=UPI0014792F7A|nr:ninjurin-1-like [Osmia lignaria]